MKKTTLLLIGALALVLQSALAQPYTLYSDDFSGQTLGGAPQTTPLSGADAGMGIDHGRSMSVFFWGATGTLDVEQVLGPSSTYIRAAVLNWTVNDEASTFGFGFSTTAHTSYANGQGSLGDITFSYDVYTGGAATAGAATPLTIWFDQFPGGVKTFDASISPTITTDGNWSHVSFTLDQLTPSGGSGSDTYDPTLGFGIVFDGGLGCSVNAGDNGQIVFGNIQLTTDLEIIPVPEPGTVTLLTLGGLGALGATKRRRD